MLAAFSAAPAAMDAQGRQITSTSQAALSAILSEVNETVLRRFVHVARRDGEALVLDVSERRIRRLVSLPQDLNAGFSDLCDTLLGSDHAPAVFDVLRVLTGGSPDLFVKTSLPEGALSGASSGVSVMDMQAVLDRSGAGSTGQPDATSCITAVCRDALASFLQVGNDTPIQHGNANRLEALKRLATHQNAEAPGSHVSLWQLDAPDAPGILAVQIRETRFACALPMDKALAHLRELSALTGPDTE